LSERAPRELGKAATEPMQEAESERQRMKAKRLSFAFMNFSESGLFNGLRAKK